MFKYFFILICLPLTGFSQQSDSVFYAAPYLKIEKANEKPSIDLADFGYNIMLHDKNAFIKEGFYMWVDDQWYQILNAKEVFKLNPNHETLFTIDASFKNPLKIKDVNDVVYLYPIEALDSYKVSYSDYNILSSTLQKQPLVNYSEKAISDVNKTPQENVVLDVVEVIDVVSNDDANITEIPNDSLSDINVDVIEDKTIQEASTNDKEVLADTEKSNTVLLDVMEVVEVIKQDDSALNTNDIIQEEIVKTQDVAENPIQENVKISATNTLIIPNPANDYEVAVNEGFDGTVTEWVEMVNAQGGKTAYEQAVDKGFVGTENEWMTMLWGRQVDVEIAKRDKTTAIVMEWIQSLNSSKGNAPYERALKHGFYGTFTEWIESVVGTDGEQAYEHAKTKGFEGTYKEWIEQQLNLSNKELLRKEQLAKTQMFIAPNVIVPTISENNQPLTFDLFDYYNKYYGAAMISSSQSTDNSVELLPTDLEYQITWFERDKIKIIELTKDGLLKYELLEGFEGTYSSLNVRYVLK